VGPLTTNPDEEPSSSDPFNQTRPQACQIPSHRTIEVRRCLSKPHRRRWDTIAARLALQYPDSDQDAGCRSARLNEYIAGEMRRPLLLLSLCVLLLLLPGLHQISQLSFSHAAFARARELAVRVAIGALAGGSFSSC